MQQETEVYYSIAAVYFIMKSIWTSQGTDDVAIKNNDRC